MKKQLTLLMLAAGTSLTMQSQVWQENFTAPFNPVSAGWDVQNLSASANPTLSWFQGVGTTFPAYNGGPNDYYAVNYNSTQSTSGATISNWLITPSITLVNGGVFEFATRTTTNPASFPDRLQVYASLAGNGTNVGSTPTSLGTFSNLIVSINNNLTTTGYPGGWTVYSFTLSGLTSPTVGRIGFRYYVTNGGPQGANSNYIGLDAVKYTYGCLATTPSYTVCSGTSVTLAVNGADPAATYTWNTAQNTSSIVVSPATTTTYNVTYSEPGWTCPAKVVTVTVGSNLSVDIAATSKTICSGQSVTLTASAAASTYSWINVGPGSSIVVTPTATTIYTVGALSSNFCIGANTVQINVNPSPTVNISAPVSPLCTNGASSVSLTFSASGASSYLWVLGTSSSTSAVVNVTLAPQTFGSFSIQLYGISGNCVDLKGYNMVIAPLPTVAITSAASPTVCKNSTITITASGADTYSWSASSSTAASIVYTAPATAGTVMVNVVGTASTGCTASASRVVTVSACASPTTVGIAENTNALNLSVYPNPFTNELKVSGVEGKATVFNTLGQIVLTQPLSGTDVINTSDFAKGAYILQVSDTNGETVKTVRLIKN